MTRARTIGVLFIVTVATIISVAQAYLLNGNVWPGSHPRVPVYVSTSLMGNVPYDGTFEEGVQAIINAMNTWNVQGECAAGGRYGALDRVAGHLFRVQAIRSGP